MAGKFGKMSEKSILVTGGAGFIGSNFIPYFLESHPEYRIVNLDKLTYAGNPANLSECRNNSRYKFVQGDIVDRDLIARLFEEHHFSGVIHFAAESHVDNSITGPGAFIETNVVGTFTLLDAARQAWMKAPHEYRPDCEGNRFHHVSTDEVYGSLGPDGFFLETTPYAPNSPYSASKASSDMLVRAWFHTYGMNVTTSNCSNNYGPKQHPEKLIPKIVSNCLQGLPIPIYGDGGNIRDWLYVLDHCRAVDLVFHRGRSGETYNIGGHCEKTNIEIARTICGILDSLVPRGNGSYSDLITFVQDRAGHDRRYAIDPKKIESELGWRPEETFESGIRKTIEAMMNRIFISR